MLRIVIIQARLAYSKAGGCLFHIRLRTGILCHGSCYGLNCIYPPNCVSPQKVLTPGTSECELIWKEGHCRYNLLRWGHIGVRWTSNTIWLLSLLDGHVKRDTHNENAMRIWRQRLDCVPENQGKPRIAGIPPVARKRQGRSPPTVFRWIIARWHLIPNF